MAEKVQILPERPVEHGGRYGDPTPGATSFSLPVAEFEYLANSNPVEQAEYLLAKRGHSGSFLVVKLGERGVVEAWHLKLRRLT